jgi:hypothetical protein
MDDQNRVQASTQDATHQETPSPSAPGRVPAGSYWQKFAEPRSWALKWCGFSLFCDRDGQAAENEPPAAPAR